MVGTWYEGSFYMVMTGWQALEWVAILLLVGYLLGERRGR